MGLTNWATNHTYGASVLHQPTSLEELRAIVSTSPRGLYPRIEDFRYLVARFDPRGVFRNAFLDRHVLRRR